MNVSFYTITIKIIQFACELDCYADVEERY